jgi:hypothetical protein
VHTTANSSGSFDHELPVDVDILNFALTLEHVENAFYTQGLSRFKQEDFVHAGFPDWTYGRLKQIAAHEAAHVEFLEKILGDKATRPCSYKLSVILGGSDFPRRWLTAYASSPYDDPKSFVTLSRALEVIGKCLIVVDCSDVSCYNTRGFVIHWCIEVLRQQGTLPSIPSVPSSEAMIADSKENLLAAATILSTESRHSAWLDSALGKGSAWSGPFDVISVGVQ